MFDTLLYTITNFASGIYILVWKYDLVKKGKTVQCFTWVTVLKIILVSKLSYQVVKNGLNWWIENIWFTVYRYISQVNSGVMVEFITYWVTKLDRFFCHSTIEFLPKASWPYLICSCIGGSFMSIWGEWKSFVIGIVLKISILFPT